MEFEWKEEFLSSLENYSGPGADKLNLENFTEYLRNELPQDFKKWRNSEYTSNAELPPIAIASYEVDSGGDVYVALLDEKGSCQASEAPGPDLFKLGLLPVVEHDQNLVAMFMAYCFSEVLEQVCTSEEFLALPRAAKVKFSVGAHSGWGEDNLFTYSGERNAPERGNVRLKQLEIDFGIHGFTKPDTVERKYMDALRALNVEESAGKFQPLFLEGFAWLANQKEEPFDYVIMAWSSNKEKPARLAGRIGEELIIWPGDFSAIYDCLPEDGLEDLDHKDHTGIRFSTGLKIAQIACQAIENISQEAAFENLSKSEGFHMKLKNRTAGMPPRFYPFDDQ